VHTSQEKIYYCPNTMSCHWKWNRECNKKYERLQ